MKEHLNNLDKAFENRTRLGIMSALVVNDYVDFNSLKNLLGVTDGNLATHLKSLEKVQYIEIKKEFLDRKTKHKILRYPEWAKGFQETHSSHRAIIEIKKF